MTEERLETPKQLAARVNLSEGQVRNLIRTGRLEHIMVGCRVLIPVGAFAQFLEAKKVKPCQDAIKDRDYCRLKPAPGIRRRMFGLCLPFAHVETTAVIPH